uniref:Large ribosomal subunit protein bL19m n=1 Tax=Daphnia similis TaxID=35528 RepID=A0A4Y7LVH7_9CRUS|nr:EOG090X0F2L [Daphnia similis]SVE71353.1 EOG090X0F2L [Daphnia similis]SVE72612.1 EOG090X0F2L [Daphnia similis]
MLRRAVLQTFRQGLAQSFFKRNAVSLSETTVTHQTVETSDEGGEKFVSTQKTGDESGNTVIVAPPEFRFMYPEFLPDPAMETRNRLKEKLERMDMLQRRSVIEIPEFYTGSVMAVTVSDANSPNKFARFVGICIQRGGSGLRAWFILRNVVEKQGVEILYEMYCPLIQKIEVLRLERRLDESLLYLRDALPEYSTFPLDMEPERRLNNLVVPINPLKVKLRPRPWLERWERQNLQGVEDLNLPQRFYDKAEKVAKPWEKYDLMLHYRKTIPAEEQEKIFAEVQSQLQQQELKRKMRRRRGSDNEQ